MMYRVLIICFLLFLKLSPAKAQTNVNEAKAAYLLAEESYGKGDYKTTLEYLDDAINKLGSANAKVLYLKIMAQREMANKDQNYLAKLDSTITLFDNAADVSSFNEDKVLEITKIKLQLKKERAQKAIEDDVRTKDRAGMAGVQRDYPDWQLGSSLAEIKAKHPDIFQTLALKQYNFFVSKMPKGTNYSVPNAEIGKAQSFYIENDKLQSVIINLFVIRDDDQQHSKGKKQFEAILKDMNARLGKPEIKSYDSSIRQTEIYSWQENKQTVNITLTLEPNTSRADIHMMTTN